MKKFKMIVSITLILTFILTNSSTPYAAKKRTTTGSAPIVSNVVINGILEVGQVLTGNYTYYDANSDIEGKSIYKWSSSSSATGIYAEISGAVSKTYTLSENDADKYIKFTVIPVSATGIPNTGTAVSIISTVTVQVPLVQSSSKIVLGFVTKYYSTDYSSYNSMVNHTSSIDQIATVTYSTDINGNLTGSAPIDQINYANSNGIKPLALVNNSDANGFNSNIAKSIIENSNIKQNFINNLINTLKINNYSGVNIDFEGVPYTDRTYYSQFIADIKNSLSTLGYLTTVSVPAKSSDSVTNTWNGAYDYKAIGSVVDEVIIMTYDEHGPWCEAGPVASITWVTNVVNYAKTVISSNKIILGLAAYGYDWSSVGNNAWSINKIDSLIGTYGGNVAWDSVSQSPHYNYTANGVAHDIWYENSYSIAFKLNLVNQNNLLGIGIWRLGLEDQAYWNTINTKLN